MSPSLPPAAPGAPGAPPAPRWRRRVEREGMLVAVAFVGLATGGMLGGAATGVAHAAEIARVQRAAQAVAVDAEPPPPLDAPSHAVPDEAPPVDDGDDAEPPQHESAPPARRAPRPRVARAALGHDPLDSATYRVGPGRVTGYRDGRAIHITVTVVDGRPVEVRTASAFERMRAAAARAGVRLRIVSAFRTMEHQRALYAAYRAGRGNLAALPGHSNHQSGHALDLNVTSPGVLRWLDAHAREYGFRRTVPSESWHWEHW